MLSPENGLPLSRRCFRSLLCLVSARLARLLSGLTLGVLLFLSFAAPAQSGAPLRSETLKAIRTQMEKGQGLFLAKDYEGAAKIFEQGYSQHSYPAFLFNSGVCLERLRRYSEAADKLDEYLRVDPDAPDAPNVRERIEKLRAAATSAVPSGDGGVDGDGGAEAGEGGAAVDAAPPPPAALPPAPADTKSLIIIETEPEGAPVRLFQKTSPTAAKFRPNAVPPGWKEVLTKRAPASVSLDEGDYHLVVEKFRDFNTTDTEVRIESGRVFHFRANLSQGKFMGFLRVSANVEGAQIYVDDPKKQRPPWGRTPSAELVSRGKHQLLVVAPGFEPLAKTVVVEQAQQVDIQVSLVRERFGSIRIDANTPEARIEVEGRPIGIWRAGQAPMEHRLLAGRRKVVVRADGHKTFDGFVEVPRGQVLPVHAELIPTPSRGAAWTQAIVGAVFLGAGTYLGLESNSLHDELEEDRIAGTLERDDERINRGRLFAIGADVGFVIGGVLAGLATYNFIKDPLPESGLSLDPVLEPGAAAPKANKAKGAKEKRPAGRTPAAGARHRRAPARGPSIEFGLLGIGGRF